MIIIENQYVFNTNDARTHIEIPFTLGREYESLKIVLKYDPGITPYDLTRKIANAAEEIFIPEEERQGAMKEFIENLILENTITTSLRYEGKYLGAWHNKSPNQEIYISKDKSFVGYVKQEILPGSYLLILSLHSINCTVNASLSVEVYDEK